MKNKEKKHIPLVYIASLGCPKNLVDSEQAAASLLLNGLGLAQDMESADILFINTCAFLESARAEALDLIRAGKKWKAKRSGRRIVVGGCLTAWDKHGTIREQIHDADAWIRPENAFELGPLSLSMLKNRPFSWNPAGSDNAPRLPLTPNHYAWLRIADGCNNHCSYCLIPSIRGPLRSRDLDAVICEAKSLIDNGVRELLVIAQDTASFGRDLAGNSLLPDLFVQLDKLKGDFVYRVLYLHPAHITRRLLNVMTESKHLLRCVEMPIQHIADGILHRMNRHIGEEKLRRVLDAVEESGFSIRTTLMTGFPGETEEDFDNLLKLVRERRFMRLGVFAFSPEKGTPAFDMPDAIPSETAIVRRALLLTEQKKISFARNKEMVGTEMDVIVDTVNADGTGTGRTIYDLPEIDNIVYLTGLKKTDAGKWIRVKITQAKAYELYAAPERGESEDSKK